MAETRNNLDKRQKLALAGLTVFGILLVGIWLLKLNSEIVGPLSYYYSPDNYASTTVQDAADKLKSQDTDGDGLSDWDELNVYGTSPYLADSDSDGIADGVEIKNGTDPNCPQGKICNSVLPVSVSSTIPTIGQLGAGQSAASSSQLEMINLLTGGSDAATLRNLLLQAGVDKASLDQISDEDLMKNYQALVASSTKGQ
ncbi:MAG: hypothetical protein PHE24_01035 [Patescibacteria group bacterium]|nr:hypothetical protein [Patescibacteria group bacterium]